MAKPKPKPKKSTPATPSKVTLEPPPTGPHPPVDDREIRREACHKAVEEACQKYNCILCVTSLNIQTGKIMPVIQVIAK